MPILDLRTVAELEEARLSLGMSEIADSSLELGGGRACRGLPGTWLNSVVGVGFAGPVERSDVEDVVAWYEAAGIEPRFELCPLAHDSIVKHLESMRFSLNGFETLFYKDLSVQDPTEGDGLHGAPDGMRIAEVRQDDEATVDECARVVATAFAKPGTPVRDEAIELTKRCALHPRSRYVAAWIDGRIVGAGAVEFAGRIAPLFGLSVDAAYRRRGVQQALIRARLAMARERGAVVSTISSMPGVGTERNVRRMGFLVAYTKVILTRPGPGLVPCRY